MAMSCVKTHVEAEMGNAPVVHVVDGLQDLPDVVGHLVLGDVLVLGQGVQQLAAGATEAGKLVL